jgi:Ran GTPase-activating protein (RanGAP) involved in mRNA processing and transport
MNDDLVKVLAKAIITNPNSKLTALELEENRIGDEGAKALAEAIGADLSNIIELKISLSFLSPEGAKSLAKAIKKNSTITLYKVVTPYISNKYDKMF